MIYLVSKFFLLTEKIIDFIRDCYFQLSEFKYKQNYGKWLKILIPKQMLQGLPIDLVRVKAGNASENLLNEIRQMIYYLCQAK